MDRSLNQLGIFVLTEYPQLVYCLAFPSVQKNPSWLKLFKPIHRFVADSSAILLVRNAGNFND